MKTIRDGRMAYIVGAYMGDGCVDDTPKRAIIKFVMADRDILDQVAAYHRTLTGHQCSVRPASGKPHLWSLQLTDTGLARALRTLSQHKTVLPPLATDSAKRNFIAGMMDTDGFISKNTTTNGKIQKKKWVRFGMGFSNTAPWLADFVRLLESFDVKVGKPTLKKKYRSPNEADCWQVGINICSFVTANLFFRCQRKQDVLLAYLAHMSRPSIR